MFDAAQASTLVEAAGIAGFDEVELIEEPVAAAMAFEHEGGDVGHGRSSSTTAAGRSTRVRGPRAGRRSFSLALEPDGDATRGGDDLDQILYDHFDAQALRELGRSLSSRDGVLDLDFLRTCRRRKESLSKSRLATFRTMIAGDVPFHAAIDRATFEGLIAEHVEQTIRISERMVARAGQSGYVVDTVLMVGGSSQLPLVQRRIVEALGVEPQKWGHRDVAVALGAAYHAHALWGSGGATPPPVAPDERYRRSVALVWSDGRLEPAEAARLDALRQELGLSPEVAAAIERAVMGRSVNELLGRGHEVPAAPEPAVAAVEPEPEPQPEPEPEPEAEPEPERGPRRSPSQSPRRSCGRHRWRRPAGRPRRRRTDGRAKRPRASARRAGRRRSGGRRRAERTATPSSSDLVRPAHAGPVPPGAAPTGIGVPARRRDGLRPVHVRRRCFDLLVDLGRGHAARDAARAEPLHLGGRQTLEIPEHPRGARPVQQLVERRLLVRVRCSHGRHRSVRRRVVLRVRRRSTLHDTCEVARLPEPLLFALASKCRVADAEQRRVGPLVETAPFAVALAIAERLTAASTAWCWHRAYDASSYLAARQATFALPPSPNGSRLANPDRSPGMSQHSPASSSFQLRGDGVEVTYHPSERLEVRNQSGLQVYLAPALSVMPVPLGHLVTARAATGEAPGTTFSLLLSPVPPGGGAVFAVAVTAPNGASWEAVALEGQAAAEATRALREEAVRPARRRLRRTRPASTGHRAGRPRHSRPRPPAVRLVDVAVDQLVQPDAADAAAPAADGEDDLPVPNEGVTLYTHVGRQAAADDDDAEPDPDDEQQSEEAEEGFLGGLTGLGDLDDGGPHLPHDLI